MIRTENVVKEYKGGIRALHGVSIDVEKGEFVFLVGPSGSGKSTVSLLLPRFYEVQSGGVRLDGVDVRDVTLDSLRRQIGVVFEESFLFSDTVRANIAYGRPDATEEEVVAAARAAEAHEFVMAMPGGYDTRLGEGGLSLSGGQRQRLALARSLVTDPEALVLDEPTSAVDSHTEARIADGLRDLRAGRTTVVLTSSPLLLDRADRVVFLHDGEVAAVGEHRELIFGEPRYRAVVTRETDDEAAEGDRVAATTRTGIDLPIGIDIEEPA